MRTLTPKPANTKSIDLFVEITLIVVAMSALVLMYVKFANF